MKRVLVAAIMVAAVGLIGFTAPAKAANANVGILPVAFKDGGCDAVAESNITTISAGDSVTWTNCQEGQHNVTSDNNAFAMKSFQHQGDFASQQFPTPGTFGYKCTIHGFSGTVIVEGTTTTLATTTTTATTIKTTTTSTSVKPASTTTTGDINGVLDPTSTTFTTETTLFSTDTTRALGAGGDDSTSAGLVALLIVGLGAVGTAGALLIRRMRAGTPLD